MGLRTLNITLSKIVENYFINYLLLFWKSFLITYPTWPNLIPNYPSVRSFIPEHFRGRARQVWSSKIYTIVITPKCHRLIWWSDFPLFPIIFIWSLMNWFWTMWLIPIRDVCATQSKRHFCEMSFVCCTLCKVLTSRRLQYFKLSTIKWKNKSLLTFISMPHSFFIENVVFHTS